MEKEVTNKMKFILFKLFVILLIVPPVFARDYRLGYGLVYSLNQLDASKIDSHFDDISAGGHSSFFFIETPLTGGFSLNMSPGAMNFEDGPSQLHVQYNLLSTNYKMKSLLFPVVGGGLGGCIATLTNGSGESGVTQSGFFVRNSTFIWTAHFGIGYRLKQDTEIIIEGRQFGFYDSLFKHLNSSTIGASFNIKV